MRSCLHLLDSPRRGDAMRKLWGFGFRSHCTSCGVSLVRLQMPTLLALTEGSKGSIDLIWLCCPHYYHFFLTASYVCRTPTMCKMWRIQKLKVAPLKVRLPRWFSG